MGQVVSTKRQIRGISGSAIKMIAIIVMLADHIGAVLLERFLLSGNNISASMSQEAYLAVVQQNATIYMVDFILRFLLGRIGFPLFCFLLVEGFLHTGNVKKYILRLGLFALISEVPFDLAFSNQFFYMGYQNVFFTLLIGLLVIYFIRMVQESDDTNRAVKVLLQVLCLIVGMGVAALLRTDYDAFGVATIFVIFAVRYYFQDRKVLAAAAGCIILTAMSLNEITAFLSLIPIALYNGKRGWNIKYLFYVFYPVHILVLYLISCFLGLGHIAVR